MDEQLDPTDDRLTAEQLDGVVAGSGTPPPGWSITDYGSGVYVVHGPSGTQIFGNYESALTWAQAEYERLRRPRGGR
jgi:hypothetical protein